LDQAANGTQVGGKNPTRLQKPDSYTNAAKTSMIPRRWNPNPSSTEQKPTYEKLEFKKSPNPTSKLPQKNTPQSGSTKRKPNISRGLKSTNTKI
jgi:hypothetical protein